MSIKSTAIFDFLLKNFSKLIKFITQSYLSHLNSFLLSSRFSVSQKSLDNYFFKRFAYKSLLSRFSVLLSYNMCSSNHFSTVSRFPCFSRSRFFSVQVFQCPSFSVSRFFRVQVSQGPGFSSSRFFRVQVFQCSVPGSRVWVQVLEVAHKLGAGKLHKLVYHNQHFSS